LTALIFSLIRIVPMVQRLHYHPMVSRTAEFEPGLAHLANV
jgi:hypothetical protein